MLYEQRDGWYTWQFFNEKVVDAAKDGDICIEIGTWLGRSATHFAELVRASGKKVQLLCVDPYYMGLHGTETVYGRHSMQRFMDFHEFTVRNGFNDILVPVLSKSDEFAHIAQTIKPLSVFIDGNHTYEGCKSDIENYWYKGVRFIGGHDYEPVNWGGVVKAVDEFANKHKIEVKNIADVWYF